MTVTAERTSHMSVEEFQQIASTAPETVTLEFIDGRIGEKAVPDGNHGRIIQWLTRICMQHRPELWLDSHQGLRVETYRSGCARPDGSLVPAEGFTGQGEWASPAPVLMAVEITSYDADTDRLGRIDKPRAYAESRIPVYLLIDRDSQEAVVHSEPDGVRYQHTARIPFGKDVELPDPVGIVLDTEPLKNWVR
ncbi:Uma2 family endonuclease [Streptomyces cacaoi]|uniref:Uma2 family endonuclease n=1 Tax=Streptomyces cacaoi TaxID=1898 RepID=UPI00374A8B51